ncbi:MAG: hypothetical protein WHT07_04815 [Desulfobaccales bacterium]
MSEDFWAFLLASVGFAMFIVCPRMAAMTAICHRHAPGNLVFLVIAGTLVSVPLLLVMVALLRNYGFAAALGFAVATDLLAALITGVISRKAAVEILIISLFVITGNRLAGWLSAKL